MLAARLANFLQAVTQLVASAVQAYSQIVHRHTQRSGHLLKRFLTEINAGEELAILRGKFRQQPVDALAEHLLGFRRDTLRELGLQAGQSPLSGIRSTVEIDDRTPKDFIEPRNHILIWAGFHLGLERLQQTVLNEILCQVRVPDALAREGHESVEVLENGLMQFWHAENITGRPRSSNPAGKQFCKECVMNCAVLR